MYAAGRMRPDAVRLLVSRGAEINIVNDRGESPLLMALISGCFWDVGIGEREVADHDWGIHGYFPRIVEHYVQKLRCDPNLRIPGGGTLISSSAKSPLY